MNIVNIHDYIKSWNIVRNLENNNPFDVIVFEDKLEIEDIPNNINVESIKDLWFEFWYSGIIAWLTQKYKNILLVIDELSYMYFLPFIKSSTESNISIINISSGISWYINKTTPDMEDLSVLSNFNIKLYEPFDFISLFKTLEREERKYIRVCDKELPNNLFQDSQENIEFAQDITSLIDFWLTWDSWTILSWWYMLPETISAVNQSIEEYWTSFDVFALLNYNFEINEELIYSLNKTEHLIIIMDQSKTSNYEQIIKSKLWEKWLIDINITFITPNTANLTTILKEYLFEQTEMDWPSIFGRLNK